LGVSRLSALLLGHRLQIGIQLGEDIHRCAARIVGDGLGASALFKRIGTDKGPWIAKDENGNVIDAPKVPVLNMVFSELHGIDLFYKDSRLKYPQTTGIY